MYKQQSAGTIERENAETQQHALDEVFTIQQMAQATGLSAHTLRYYERAGLMKHQVGRGETNGYRVYTRQHLDWIEFIKRLRATGIPIRDIQRYLEKSKLTSSFTGLETALDMHFLINRFDVRFHGIDRNHQRLCYLLSGVSLGQQAKNLKFLW